MWYYQFDVCFTYTYYLIILIFIGRLDIDRAENLVSHLSEKMVQRLEEIEETLLQQAIQQISQDKLNLLMDQEFEMVQHIVKVALNASPTV